MPGLHYADVLIQPVISERTNDLMVLQNKYVFLIAPKATKIDVKRAVSERFKVEVSSVHIINLPRKPKRFGRRLFMSGKRRKAIVSLVEGQRIAELSEAI